MPDGIYALRDPSSGLPAFNMNNEFNLFGCKTSLTGRLQECFPVIDDEPIVKEVVKPVIEKRSWGLNLFVGVLATAALAACAIVAGPATLVGVCLIGAAIGAATVTTAVAISDYNKQPRTFGEFLGQLAFGITAGAAAGAAVYALWTAAPIAAQALGIQSSMWLGTSSSLTYTIIPNIVKIGGYGAAVAQGIYSVNEIYSIGSGNNILLDKVFGGDQAKYDSSVMLLELLSMGFGQLAVDNAGLAEESSNNNSQRGQTETTDTDGDLETPSTVIDIDEIHEGVPNAKGESEATKPNQVHHYATNKNKTYTQKFEEILNKYGLDLDDEWNKEILPHQGRHPNAYHDFVYEQLQEIDAIAQGDKEIFLELYEQQVKSVIRNNPDMLYKDYWLNGGTN